MKNKKFKLFASLTSLVMVVAVMAVGVWAATQASLTVNTSVSFSASGFTGTFSANYKNGDNPAVEYENAGAKTVAIVAGGEQTIPQWDITQLPFAATGDKDIVFTFTMADISAESAVSATLSVKVGTEDAVTATTTEVGSTNIGVTIDNGTSAATGTITSKVTLSVVDPTESFGTGNGTAIVIALTYAK